MKQEGSMSLTNAGAVLLLEVRPDARARGIDAQQLEARLAEVRLLLESPQPGLTWTFAGGIAFGGRLTVENCASALPFVYRLRTELRKDPAKPPLVVLAGLGRGEELVADRLASEAFRCLSKRKHAWTCAMTPEENECRVLSAFCRALDTFERGWTDAQWEAIYRRDQDITLQEIGDELGIAYQNVSKRLIAANYSLHKELLEAACLVFSNSPLPHA
jgi:hypothetical protein